MDYYESVVIDYLRADRAIFVNTEYCVQLKPGTNPDKTGPHWYCDAVALNFRWQEILLCEISYSVSLGALAQRLKGWNDNWDEVCAAVWRDSCLGYRLSEPWPVRPWLFVPEGHASVLKKQLEKIKNGQSLRFTPKVTHLEDVQPWRFRTFNLNDEETPKGVESKAPIVLS